MKDNRLNTNIIKGVLIVIVMLNHLINGLPTGYTTTGFANLAIQGFFILSGYGLYKSFKAKGLENVFTTSLISKIYLKQFLRIYFVYFVYLVANFLIGKPVTFQDILLISQTGHIWFLSALLICYIMAPFIYKFIISNKVSILVIVSIIIILNIIILGLESRGIGERFIHWLSIPPLGYRNIFLYPIILFSGGMFLNRIKLRKYSNLVFLVSILVLTINLIVTNIISRHLQFNIFSIVLYLQFSFIFLIFIKYFVDSLNIKSKKIINLIAQLGKYSFNLYLFHLMYFSVIRSMAAVPIVYVFLLMLYSPFFLSIIMLIEKINEKCLIKINEFLGINSFRLKK